jgi:hypothetical protein
LYNVPEIIGNGFTKTFANDLAGILNSELDLKVFVPVRVYLQTSFTNPFGVILVNGCNFKIVFDSEFFQSSPD